MIEKPSNNRSRLDWHATEHNGNNFTVVLPVYYAKLFSCIYPNIVDESVNGWKFSKSGKTKIISFNRIDSDSKDIIEDFIISFKQYILINLNKNIFELFSDELDYCIALDFTYEKGLSGNKHTPTGHFVYRAKNCQDDLAIDTLSTNLFSAFGLYPKPEGFEQAAFTSIPTYNKKYDLPSILCEKVIEKLNSKGLIRASLLESKLICKKPEYKNLSFEKKVQVWDELYNSGCVELSTSIKDSDVFIIDDIYQSGITIWSYARFLLSQGAKRVFGLVCEKTWKDDAN